MRVIKFGILLFLSVHAFAYGSPSLHGDLSVRLFKTLLKSSETGNLVFSPYAIRHALGMAATAARGSTLRQLGKGPEALPVRKTKLNVASRIWLQNGIPVSEAFMEACEKTYKDRPWFVDFTQAPDFLKNRVNGWVEEKTSGKIRNFINEDSVDPSMKIFLSSALYFEAEWLKPFELERNRLSEFTTSQNKSIKTKFIKGSGNFNYLSTSSLQVLEIPYQDSDLSLIIFLPAQGQELSDLEDSLSSENVDGWLSRMALREVSVTLPKFEIQSSIELSGAMKTIGVSDAFTAGAADFAGLTPRKDLYLNRFYHKTALAVTESDTEAASSAGTGSVSRSPASSGDHFEAKRPFLFGVRHRGARTFVLLGRFAEPAVISDAD